MIESHWDLERRDFLDVSHSQHPRGVHGRLTNRGGGCQFSGDPDSA